MKRLPDPLGPCPLPFALPAPPDPPARPLPRLTVVTPSFNQGSFLEATIRSVLSQGYPELEYMVVDGGSTDGSKAIIDHYSAHLAWSVSEADRGQADALGKGLRRATGEWFVWINSDDLLAPHALWRVAAAATPGVDVVAGVTQYFAGEKPLGRRPSRRFEARAVVLEQLGSGFKWHQPSVWLRRAELAAVGIDASRHYAFDHEMLIRYLHRHPRVRYLDEVLAWFRYHDASKTVAHGDRFRREQVEMLRQLAGEAQFAGLRADLDRAARAVEWLRQVDGWLDDRTRPRLQRLRELLSGARADREARCTANTRRAARRILQYGGRRR